MPPLYDAHQHFHFDQFVTQRTIIAVDLRTVGLQRAVVNATNEEEWPVVAALAREYSWIVPSHGIHPWDCGNRSAAWLESLRAVLRADPMAGVGEIGLDRWIIDGIKPGEDIRYHEANLPELIQQQMIESSTRLFERLGCRDYARFDFRADSKGEIKLLEVNPNPGWCWDGKLNIMAGFAGIRYSELLGQVLAAAVERYNIVGKPQVVAANNNGQTDAA